MTATSHNGHTGQLLRSILDGESPGEIDPLQHGEFADAVQALQAAVDSGGKDGARKAFSALAKSNPGLSQLVAGGGSTDRRTIWTLPELLQADFPEPRWGVKGLFPVGLSSMAGRPKVGKTRLAFQLAVSIGSGGYFLGQAVEQGKVFILALEDSPRRLKTRMLEQGVSIDAQIQFATAWKALNAGGLELLQERILMEDYRVVIIDTFSRAIGRADQMDAAEMTELLGHLQQLALGQDLAILLIDHHRKSSGFASDPIDDLMGSTAKAAVLDAALGLYREPGRHGATLKVIGREIEERELALEWDGRLNCWQLLGPADEVRQGTLKGEIVTAITALENMGERPTTARIALHLGKNRGQVSRNLGDLVMAGKVLKDKKQGKEQPYRLP
ncbi:MAG: AAA family ATPase [Gemmatimonadetes bacterium]|jgi:hypothetical protein|nr:AAA family ATPase [Gemmatimonadota bacterium]